MSRIERKQEEKLKKISKRPKYRLIFIIIMMCITSICIFSVDKEATLMIGRIDNYNLEVFIGNISSSCIKSIKKLEEKVSKMNELREY